MDKLLAPCGIDCAECEAYKATQENNLEDLREIAVKWTEQYRTELTPDNIKCDGCLAQTDRNGCYSKMCSVRRCATSKKVTNCANCRDYGCDRLIEIHAVAPEAKTNLEAIRPKKKR